MLNMPHEAPRSDIGPPLNTTPAPAGNRRDPHRTRALRVATGPVTNSGQGKGDSVIRSGFVVLIIFIFVLLSIPGVSEAGPLLDSALKLAANTRLDAPASQQPMGCAAATAAGQDLANQREGMGGYLVGGIFIPVVMPLIGGLVANPTPPASELLDVHDDDVDCFREGYRERGRSKKVRGGWIGTAIGVGAYVALGVLAGVSRATTQY